MAPPRKPRHPCPVCLRTVENPKFRFCSNTCQNEFQYRRYIERWQAGLETGNTGSGRNLQVSNFVKRFLFAKHACRCSRCGWSETNPTTGKVPLNVEHIDGDPWNSCEANLTLLCPNCHSLTPTFGALNKGRGRESRIPGP